MKKILLLSVIGFCINNSSFSQGGSTGIGTTTPHASSILDISSNNKGVLFPRVSSTQRKAISNPAIGLMVYDIDKRTIFLYDGSQWLPLMTAGNSAGILPETVRGNDVEGGDGFGVSVAISGNYAIVGALSDSDGRGSAYIFFRNGGKWTQQAKLTAGDGAVDDYFGGSVAIDGDYAVVGAYGDDILTSNPPIIINYEDRGSIYIFQRNGASWTQQTELTSTVAVSSLWFGFSLAMDGNRIAVGANGDGAGSAYVYQRSGSLWIFQQRITAADGVTGDAFGNSIDISGNYLVIGAPWDDNATKTNAGSAYIYFYNGVNWSLQYKHENTVGATNDNEGQSVAISDSLVLIGIPYRAVDGIVHGVVLPLRRTGTTWNPMGTINVPDGINYALTGMSLALHGSYAIIGAPDGFGNFAGFGTTYLYKITGNTWILQQKINHPALVNNHFGNAVAIDAFNIIIGCSIGSYDYAGVAFLNIE